MTFTVYIALDVDMQPLYVGSTTDMWNRLTWHQDESPWIVDCYRMLQHECPDKATMLSEERRLIARHNPPWNWLSRTNPNPRPKPTRAECRALLAERRELPGYLQTAEWRLKTEFAEAVSAGLPALADTA